MSDRAKFLLALWLPIARRADLAKRLGMPLLSATIMRRGITDPVHQKAAIAAAWGPGI